MAASYRYTWDIYIYILDNAVYICTGLIMHIC